MGICSGISMKWLFMHCFHIKLEFKALIFVEGGKSENPEKNPQSRDKNQQQTQPTYDTWGPFLERLGNLTGPKSYFEIKFSRKVGCVLTSNEVRFVSLAENFTVQFSNLLKLLSRMKNKTA